MVTKHNMYYCCFFSGVLLFFLPPSSSSPFFRDREREEERRRSKSQTQFFFQCERREAGNRDIPEYTEAMSPGLLLRVSQLMMSNGMMIDDEPLYYI